MNIILALLGETQFQHLIIEEILKKAKNGILTNKDILSYENTLKEDILKFNNIHSIIKDEKIECYSKKGEK